MNTSSSPTPSQAASPVRVGVIGAGYWGPNLVRNFDELPGAQLVAVCDQDHARLERIRQHYPDVLVTPSQSEFLAAGLEAAAIAAPVSKHCDLAQACMQAGLHVLVEKPLAGSLPEAQAIVRAGQQAGRLVMTGHTFRYNPAVIALKEIINSGEIGEVYYIDGVRANLGLYQPDTNVVWDLAPHDISILFYLLGEAPQAVAATGRCCLRTNQHDLAYLTLYYSSERVAALRLSWLDPDKVRRLTIVGSRKMLVYDDLEPVDKVKIYDKRATPQPYTGTDADSHTAYHHGSVQSVVLDWEEPLRKECRHFLDCIRTGHQPWSDGYDGLRVVQVLAAADHSLQNGHSKEVIAW